MSRDIAECVQKVGSEIVTYKSLGSDNDKPVVFMHGFGVGPDFYKGMIDALAINGMKVIAPVAYGMNVFENQPTTISEYAELTAEFMHSLGIDDYVAVGHSMGGSVGYEMASMTDDVSHAIGFNPVLPNNHNLATFGAKALLKGAIENIGAARGEGVVKFGWTVPAPFFGNAAKNPMAFYKTIQDICSYDFPGSERDRIKQPCLLVGGGDDEYFDLDLATHKDDTFDMRFALGQHFDDMTVVDVGKKYQRDCGDSLVKKVANIARPNYNHDGIVMFDAPNAVYEVIDFLHKTG